MSVEASCGISLRVRDRLQLAGAPHDTAVVGPGAIWYSLGALARPPHRREPFSMAVPTAPNPATDRDLASVAEARGPLVSPGRPN